MRKKIKKLWSRLQNKMYYPSKKPRHIVIETDKAVYIDGKKIRFVVEDSVKTESLGDYTVVTLSFLAKEFLKR